MEISKIPEHLMGKQEHSIPVVRVEFCPICGLFHKVKPNITETRKLHAHWSAGDISVYHYFPLELLLPDDGDKNTKFMVETENTLCLEHVPVIMHDIMALSPKNEYNLSSGNFGVHFEASTTEIYTFTSGRFSSFKEIAEWQDTMVKQLFTNPWPSTDLIKLKNFVTKGLI